MKTVPLRWTAHSAVATAMVDFSLALSPLVALKQIFERSENNSTNAAGTLGFV
jgi:hypothetical protein